MLRVFDAGNIVNIFKWPVPVETEHRCSIAFINLYRRTEDTT